MRSSAPRVDDRYGIPLPHPASAGRPRPYDPISHRNSPGLDDRGDPISYRNSRGAAPPFSPASGPALDASPSLAPLAHTHTAVAGQGDAGHNGEWVFDQDSSQSLDTRAPRDVFDDLHNVPEAGGAYRTPSPAPARLSHAMPQDIVTSMALSLGAPARPSRADGSARRPATMREVFQPGSVAGAANFATQSYGRMCDLLFFGDEMPIALSVVEFLSQMGRASVLARGVEASTAGSRPDRALSCLIGVFRANDQMNRLLRACAQQQIKQSKTRKDLLRGDCASKRIILSYFGMVAGDFLQRLIAPTVRALQGPWTATEAGLKGALDRVLTKLASIDAPKEMQTGLKILYACISKTYGNRAVSTLASMLIGDLFGTTLRSICAKHQVEALTTDGVRFLESMASVLSKLSVNESFAGNSKLYHMNSWIQLRYEGFEKSMHKLLDVQIPAFTAWNSGCVVEGPVQDMHTLLHTVMEHKDEIMRICMAQVWSMQTAQSSYQSRVLILWAALEGTRRRGASDHMPLNSSQSPDKESHADASSLQTGLLGQMSKMVNHANRSGGKAPTQKSNSNTSRMQHLSATVTDMDLSSRNLVLVPKLDHFKNLRTLNISHNSLTELGDLPASLCRIDCSHNQLSEMPCLNGLTKLETVNISHNMLHASRLVDGNRITSLDVSYNRLSAVVDCCNLPELCHLLIGHNLIRSVQDLRILAHNSNLRSIAVEGNPLCDLEAGYLKHLAMILPQLTSIDEASIVSAQYRGQPAPTQSPWSQLHSDDRPAVSPLLEPALLSPRTHPQVSPLLHPAAPWHSGEHAIPALEQAPSASPRISPICKHELSIPCAVRVDEDDFDGVGAHPSVLFEADGLNGGPHEESFSSANFPKDTLEGIHDRVHAAASMTGAAEIQVAKVTLKLGIKFSAVGGEFSQQRVQFIRDLARDLENASGIPKAFFHVTSVSPGSVIVDLDICAHRAYEVAHDLQTQSQDPLSALRAGPVTRTLEALTISTAICPRAHTRNSEGLPENLWQERQDAREKAEVGSTTKFLDPGRAHTDVHSTRGPASRRQILSARPAWGANPVTAKKAAWSPQASPPGKIKTTHHDHDSRKSNKSLAAGHHSMDISPKSGAGGPNSRTSGRAEPVSAKKSAPPEAPKVLDPPAQPDPRHTTRIASSHEREPIYKSSKRTSSPPKASALSCALSAETDLVLTNIFASNSALDTSVKSRESSGQYEQVNIAEMVKRISDELKVMGLVFRGWKLVLSFSRLAHHLAHPQSHLVLVSGARYRRFTLRHFWGPWADLMITRRHRVRSVDEGGRVARFRLTRQLLHAWRELLRFRQLLAAQVRRRQCEAVHVAMWSWLQVAEQSRVKRARCYRSWKQRGAVLGGIIFEAWKGKQREGHRLMVVKRRICRMLLNRKVGTAFEAFVEIRERAHRIECDVSAIVKRMQADMMGASIVAWRHSANKRMHVSAFVTKVCRGFFTVDVGLHFRAWSEHMSRRSWIVGVSRHVLSRKERIRLLELVRAWRLLIFRPEAQNRILHFCIRRSQAASRRKCIECWVGFRKSVKQHDQMHHRCGAMIARAHRSCQVRAFEEWLHLQCVKRQHGVAILRALHRRSVRGKHAAFACLRNTALLCKVRHLADEIILRKETRRTMRDLMQEWHRQMRHKKELLRRAMLVASKQGKCDMRKVLCAWHAVAYRRFQVAAMLDKILLKRKQQHSSPEHTAGGRGPRLGSSSSYPQHQQPSTSPRRSESGN